MTLSPQSADADRRLVVRIVSDNDTAAFGELVSRHQSQVRNFLRRLTRDPDLAEDLAQDTFVHAWDRLHGYTGKGSVIGWLLKVAYTTFLQSKRRSRRYGEILDQIGADGMAGGRLAATDCDEISDLDRFLAVLGEEERAVMILSYACGLSHREIADATSQPVGTIKSIIFRGKEKIRQNFDIDRYQHG
ncbi:MAG: sigma-70 family RNA polymerase sigma factor [Woeseiaceae bacterium]|nr:sigma-70 family RNA polymerase sigma factor [Woeseiaceae bacterium]